MLQECTTIGTLLQHWWGCKTEESFWMTVWQFLTKLNILLPCDPANDIYLRVEKCMPRQKRAAHNCLWQLCKCPNFKVTKMSFSK